MIHKFRAWHINKQIMCEVIRIDFEQGIITLDLETDDDEYYWMETDWNFSDVEIMQYTGCRDKNGIEIYEGDVIKDKYDKIWLVQYYVGAFVITNKIPDSDGQTSTYSHFSNLSNHHFYFEVIGNMWNNPELLEVVE